MLLTPTSRSCFASPKLVAYSSEELITNLSCLAWNGSLCILGNHQKQSSPLVWSHPAKWASQMECGCVGKHLQKNISYWRCSCPFHVYVLMSHPPSPIRDQLCWILAIYWAIKISIKNHSVVLESDSVNAVNWCNDDMEGHGTSTSN